MGNFSLCAAFAKSCKIFYSRAMIRKLFFILSIYASSNTTAQSHGYNKESLTSLPQKRLCNLKGLEFSPDNSAVLIGGGEAHANPEFGSPRINDTKICLGFDKLAGVTITEDQRFVLCHGEIKKSYSAQVYSFKSKPELISKFTNLPKASALFVGFEGKSVWHALIEYGNNPGKPASCEIGQNGKTLLKIQSCRKIWILPYDAGIAVNNSGELVRWMTGNKVLREKFQFSSVDFFKYSTDLKQYAYIGETSIKGQSNRDSYVEGTLVINGKVMPLKERGVSDFDINFGINFNGVIVSRTDKREFKFQKFRELLKFTLDQPKVWTEREILRYETWNPLVKRLVSGTPDDPEADYELLLGDQEIAPIPDLWPRMIANDRWQYKGGAFTTGERNFVILPKEVRFWLPADNYASWPLGIQSFEGFVMNRPKADGTGRELVLAFPPVRNVIPTTEPLECLTRLLPTPKGDGISFLYQDNCTLMRGFYNPGQPTPAKTISQYACALSSASPTKNPYPFEPSEEDRTLMKEFLSAVSSLKFGVVEDMLVANPKIHKLIGGQERGALCAASSTGELAMMELLLKHSFSFRGENVFSCALFPASFEQAKRTIEYWSKKGANPNHEIKSPGQYTKTLMFFHMPELLAPLMKAGYKPTNADLTTAIGFKSVPMVESLLKAGVSPNVEEDRQGPLMLAVSSDSPESEEIARLLLKYGADPEGTPYHKPINAAASEVLKKMIYDAIQRKK